MDDKEDFDELQSDYGDAEEYDADPEDPNVFRIRNPLAVPTASIHTTKDLHRMIHDGRIDLNPPYQRDVVWTEAKQIALIDSIFRNYYIPPILFLVSKDEDGETVRVCMDGKQRLTSIQKFFDGQIPHRDSVTKKKYWYTRPEAQSASRMTIPEHFMRLFASKEITCVEYEDLNPGVERDIFQRVQMGVTLTAAEKLAAIDSPWAQWINELDARHITKDDGLAVMLNWDTKRGRHFQCVAQLVYCCANLPARTEPTMHKLEQWLPRADEPWPSIKKDVEEVLVTYWTIAAEKSLNAAFKMKKRVAPVEFVFIGVLLAVLADYPIEHKAIEIENLRKHVRQLHKDVRANSRVVTTMWGFIEDAQNRAGSLSRHAHNGDTNPSNTKKRKKRGGDGDEDEDYKPNPLRNLGPLPTTRSRTTK